MVYAVCNGRSLPSLVGPVLFRILPIDDKYRPASLRTTDRPTAFSVKYIQLSNVLPLVRLLKVVAVLVDALGYPSRPGLRLTARASGGRPWFESTYSGISMNTNPAPLFTSLGPIVARRLPWDRVDERDRSCCCPWLFSDGVEFWRPRRISLRHA